MDQVTLQHRRQELQVLLSQIQMNPSRDSSNEQQRIVVLQQMIAAEARHSAARTSPN